MSALRRRLTFGVVLQWLVLSVASVMTIVPVVVTLYSSFKNNTDFFYSTWALPKSSPWPKTSDDTATYMGLRT